MMKLNATISILSAVMLMFTAFNVQSSELKKGPVVIEVNTSHSTVKDALVATKTELLQHKFILQGAIEETSFTVKRTTGAEADYYVADVMAEKKDSGVKLTITFVKVGTGLLKLQKVADKVKSALEK